MSNYCSKCGVHNATHDSDGYCGDDIHNRYCSECGVNWRDHYRTECAVDFPLKTDIYRITLARKHAETDWRVRVYRHYPKTDTVNTYTLRLEHVARFFDAVLARGSAAGDMCGDTYSWLDYDIKPKRG